MKELNQHISDALEQWADTLLSADTNRAAFDLNYTPSDLFNALCIFNHVAMNIGIKNGTIDWDNVSQASTQLRDVVIALTGLDPAELAK